MKTGAGLFAILAGLLSMPAAAQDKGVPAGKVIFYPSLEVNFQSEDNVFLLNEKDPLSGEVQSAQQYYVAHFKWEMPFSKSKTSIDWSPSYRDFSSSSVSLPDKFSQSLRVDSELNFSNGSRIRIEDRFIRDNITVREVANSEVPFGTDTFRSNDFGFGFDYPILANQRIGGEVRSRILKFSNKSDPGFFDSTGLDLTAKYEYDPSPVNTVTVEYRFGDTDQDRRQSGTNLVAEDFVENSIHLSWKGTGNRRVNYELRGGLQSLRFKRSDDSDFSGAVGDVRILYHLTPLSVLRGRATREAFSSFFDAANYYVSNHVEMVFEREISERVSWNVRGDFRLNRYPDSIQNLSGSYAPSLGLKRKDRLGSLEARLDYQFYRTLSVGAFVRYERRDSNVIAEIDPDGPPPTGGPLSLVQFPQFDYESTRIGFQVRFGWQ
ncbi:MAG: outer membrane beta-barrel protein [Acidobacteria bacterium]|nr:outer membrane beta-barrel protein [Acidobacteriota bacterium]